MNLLASVMILFSVLFPAKTWFAPTQSVDVTIKASEPVQLVLLKFDGTNLPAKGDTTLSGEKTVDIKALFPQIADLGTFVLLAVPTGKTPAEFLGTPLVIETRAAPKPTGPISANVIRVEPLVYATIQTPKGEMKAVFWYDVAPNTVESFISLARGGFYDGLTFHRIVPGFVIQGGDPTGTGFGGPGYNIDAEFSDRADRAHDEGVLSMARGGDPLESKGVAPRSDYANSAGSQFFICLTRQKTQSLDRKYTAFGKVVQGMPAVNAIAAAEIADPSSGKPREPQVIDKVVITSVTAQDNPYTALLRLSPEVLPASQPAK